MDIREEAGRFGIMKAKGVSRRQKTFVLQKKVNKQKCSLDKKILLP